MIAAAQSHVCPARSPATAAQWIRWIHECSHSGPVWQFVVFLTGVFPLVFVVTGVIMWWRGRRSRREVAAGRAADRGELQAAE